MCCLNTGCSTTNDLQTEMQFETTINTESQEDIVGDEQTESDISDEQQMEIDEYNKSILTQALGIEEDDRDVKSYLYALNKIIKAGKIQLLEVVDSNKKIINITAEDGTEYQICLWARGGVDYVKDLTNNKWLSYSTR